MNIEYEYKIDSNTKNLNKDLEATTRHIHVLAKIIISYHKIEKKNLHRLVQQSDMSDCYI